MNIETLVQYAVLHNAVSFLWSHRASSQRVPSGFCVTLQEEGYKVSFRLLCPSNCVIHLDPFDDMVDVFSGVNQITSDFLFVAAQETWTSCFPGLDRHTPAAMLDSRRDVVRPSIYDPISSEKINEKGRLTGLGCL